MLRYFGTAFRTFPLDDDLRPNLLMSPVSMLELLSQLVNNGSADALSAVKAVPNIYDPAHAELLPWPKDAFREAVFGLPPRPDTLANTVTKAVNDCLAATTAQELVKESSRLRDLFNQAKDETTNAFADLVKAWKSDGPMPHITHRRIFAESIAKRAEVSINEDDVDRVINCLCSLYVYEIEKLKIAAANENYKVKKNENDYFDAEQLAYLAYPGLNFLTCDKGFNRTAASSQFKRIHVVAEECLSDHAKASALIGSILKPAQ